jgi:histidinol dehydrogenase
LERETLQKAAFSQTAPVEDHRGREKGFLVYPVYSRRSGGLSVGLNLFPSQKSCPFDCPYCEVFPFSVNEALNNEVSVEKMETGLCSAISAAQREDTPIKDICFSGNGEPSLSPAFPGALKMACKVREKAVPNAELVLITNGAGLLKPQIFSLLKDTAVSCRFFNIWLKLDAGTPGWYQKMNRCAIPHEKLIAKIKEFTACAPVTIQTMLCSIEGKSPSEEEEAAWEKLTLELAAAAGSEGGIRKVQLYGKARSSPEDPLASPLPVEYLEKRSASLRRIFLKNSISTLVETYQ